MMWPAGAKEAVSMQVMWKRSLWKTSFSGVWPQMIVLSVMNGFRRTLGSLSASDSSFMVVRR